MMRKPESPAEQPGAAMCSEAAQATPGGSVEHSNPLQGCSEIREEDTGLPIVT